MPKNKYESRCVMNKNITDMKAAIKNTVREVDIPRYMGVWHEIARYENHFEKDMINVTATYTLQPNGSIKVENAGYRNGVFKKATGRAKQPDPQQPGKLKVSFFLWFYSDYYILELDQENYGYVLVGSSTDKYLWILSREKQLPEDIKEQLLSMAVQWGYDTTKLIFN